KTSRYEELKFSKYAFFGIITACVYVAVVPLIGYLISTAIIFPISMYLLGMRNVKTFVISTAGYLVAAYVVFFKVLGVIPPSL
ncbi:MAG: tripartite tricarboxylate transporter TctB family protein, partial [Desulfocucumaceae bacterium]